jgi:hypothetical protein
MSTISRRELLAKAGLAGLAAAIAPEARSGKTHSEDKHSTSMRVAGSERDETQYLFFNREEAQFFEAAVARLIPSD